MYFNNVNIEIYLSSSLLASLAVGGIEAPGGGGLESKNPPCKK